VAQKHEQACSFNGSAVFFLDCVLQRRADAGITIAAVFSVDRGTAVSAVAEQVLRTGRRCFFVTDDGHITGLLTPQELRGVPRDRWNATPAVNAMKPLERLHQVEAGEPVTKALRLCRRM
jgi:hypothetical protein